MEGSEVGGGDSPEMTSNRLNYNTTYHPLVESTSGYLVEVMS